MYNRFTGGNGVGITRGVILTEAEVEGMKECISDQGARIAELEADVESWREIYTDTSKQLDASRDAGKMVVEELSEMLAEERAEADLFHAAYVGMCAMHPNRAVFTSQSHQEH